MLKRYRSSLIACLASFAAVWALTSPGSARAVNRRVHSSICTLKNDLGSAVANQASIFVTSGVSSTFLYCPIPSDSTLTHIGITTINVHGFQGPDGPNVSYACVKYYNASGNNCGAGKSWGANYSGALGVSTDGLQTSSTGFPYLMTRLYSASNLYGFYVAN